MRDPYASDFCYYPFFQVLVTAEGKYRPCSKHVDHITNKGKVLTTADSTLEDAWNSDYMTSMREDFNANRKFPGCAECWRLQKIGLKSMRYDSYQYNISEEQVANPVIPSRVELNSSNVCNMRCRICFATASTLWLAESKKLYGFDENMHINLSSKNLEQVKAWAKNLSELALFGGEPLLLPGNIDLLDHLIENDYAKKVSLLFNTNGTIFTKEISDRLKKFRRVRISFSIDDIGERFEYQRSGGKWSEVEANLKAAYALFNSPGYEHIQMKICNTVSMFNAYYLPEFFDYFSREFPGLTIFFNYLFNPTRMNVQILPDAEKKVVIDRIRAIKPNFNMEGEDGKLIENIITYIEYREKRPFSQFFQIFNRHDVYRQESFIKVFPEFWELIKHHKPAELCLGEYEDADILALKKYDAQPESEAFPGMFKESYLSIMEQEGDNMDADNNELLVRAAYDLFGRQRDLYEDREEEQELLGSYLDFLQQKKKVGLSSIINYLRKTYRENVSMPTTEDENYFAAFSLFETRKSHVSKNEMARLFAECFELVNGPQNGLLSTIPKIAAMYIKSITVMAGFINEQYSNDHIHANLEWIRNFFIETDGIPNQLVQDIINTPSDGFLEVVNREDIPQIRSRMVDNYQVVL